MPSAKVPPPYIGGTGTWHSSGSIPGSGTIEATTDQPAGRSVADLVADVLAEGPLTLAKIRAAIKEDTGRDVSEDSLRTVLARDSRRFVQAVGKRPRPWSLR